MLEPDVAKSTVVVLVAQTIVLLTVDDTVVLPNGARKTSGSEVVTLVVEWLTDVLLAVTLVVVTAEE